MLHNPKLARRIADAGWATIHQQLVYNQAWAGGQLTIADRWVLSSKTCSACGEVREIRCRPDALENHGHVIREPFIGRRRGGEARREVTQANSTWGRHGRGKIVWVDDRIRLCGKPN